MAHSFIEVVSRDGFTSFHHGISNANAALVQIYDRWYFIQNAKKQASEPTGELESEGELYLTREDATLLYQSLGNYLEKFEKSDPSYSTQI